MKNIKNHIILVLLSFCFVSVQAQTQTNKVVTDTLTVLGNCGMCKSRIEAALDTKGIKAAEWDIQTKLLVVSYVPSKISLEQINQLIISVGHDTNSKKAEDGVYSTLPGCCRFRENPNTHTD
jgi:copper chaperone CopZ